MGNDSIQILSKKNLKKNFFNFKKKIGETYLRFFLDLHVFAINSTTGIVQQMYGCSRRIDPNENFSTLVSLSKVSRQSVII
jgi:hypothetical protein